MPKVVTFGEVMLRLSTPGYLRFSQAHQFDATFGGGEANVAVSLANYGIDTQFVTRLPKNDIADMCVAELRGFGVRHPSSQERHRRHVRRGAPRPRRRHRRHRLGR